VYLLRGTDSIFKTDSSLKGCGRAMAQAGSSLPFTGFDPKSVFVMFVVESW
jgi:hypothetical protein